MGGKCVKLTSDNVIHIAVVRRDGATRRIL